MIIIGLILTLLITVPVLMFAVWWGIILWYQDHLKDNPPTKDEWKVM